MQPRQRNRHGHDDVQRIAERVDGDPDSHVRGRDGGGAQAVAFSPSNERKPRVRGERGLERLERQLPCRGERDDGKTHVAERREAG